VEESADPTTAAVSPTLGVPSIWAVDHGAVREQDKRLGQLLWIRDVGVANPDSQLPYRSWLFARRG
jgi:hypothetical protein